MHEVCRLLDADNLKPSDAQALSNAQVANLQEGMEAYFRGQVTKPATDPVGARKVALRRRRLDDIDLLDQLLLYFQTVAMPDPISAWAAEAAMGGVSDAAWLEQALREHARLEPLTTHGAVEFYPTHRDVYGVEVEYHWLSKDLVRDPSVARELLGGALPVSDLDWELDYTDGDNLSQQDYIEWTVRKTDLEKHWDKASDPLLHVVPDVDAAGHVGARLVATSREEEIATAGLFSQATQALGADRAVSRLTKCRIDVLSGLTPGDILEFRKDDDSWNSWQKFLSTTLAAHANHDVDEMSLLVNDALRERVGAVAARAKKGGIAKRVLVESSAADFATALFVWLATANELATAGAVFKGVFSPVYRAMVHQGPSGADAILMSLARPA